MMRFLVRSYALFAVMFLCLVPAFLAGCSSSGPSIATPEAFSLCPGEKKDVKKPLPAINISNGQFIYTTYVLVLNREPDPGGFATHCKALAAGTSRKQVLDAFIGSPEFKARADRPAAAPASAK